MAGLTQIERHLVDWVDRKYAGRIISRMNTEWEQQLEGARGLPDGVGEYDYMRNRILEIHREINNQKGAKIDDDETKIPVLDSGGDPT